MNKSIPHISVIIPFFNELKLINRTINSVLINSTFIKNKEIIIVNDGPYHENDILDNLDDKLISFVKIKNNKFAKGPGGARNTGIEFSKGEIIAFLDADDFWLPGKLEAQMQEIRKGATFVATSYQLDKSKTIINPPNKIDKPEDVFLRRGIGTSTIILTKELLENHKFREIRFAQDIDFWFTLAKSNKFKYAGISEVFVEYNTGGSTKNKWVQLYYVNKILALNNTNILIRIRFNFSYILIGIYNHYIRNLLFSRK